MRGIFTPGVKIHFDSKNMSEFKQQRADIWSKQIMLPSLITPLVGEHCYTPVNYSTLWEDIRLLRGIVLVHRQELEILNLFSTWIFLIWQCPDSQTLKRLNVVVEVGFK